MENITIEKGKLANILFECYTSGVSYGQLIMEEEREKEEMFDGLIGALSSQKFSMPTHPTEKRELHSERWFETKRREGKEFYKIMKEILG